MREVAFACILLLLTMCRNEQVNHKKWSEVDEHINKSWEKYIGTHAMLPHPFAYAISNEDLYYWDTYFTNKGLIRHQKWDIVLNNLNDYIFEIDTFGFIPNTNQVWSLNRSQPPFFSMMVKDYYLAAPEKDKQWLQKAYKAILQEYMFWIDTSKNAIEDNTTTIAGLLRYNQHCEDSILIGVYDHANERFGGIPEMNEDQRKEFGRHFFAECESGMDFSWRFQMNCANYVALDLNSNLYKYESNFVWFENELGIEPAANWDSLANERKALINKYCWDKERKLFADFNYVENGLSPVASFCMLYPMLWEFATPQQAEAIKDNLVKLLLTNNGVVATQKAEAPYQLQWDHTSIWPPVQWVAYRALKNYGYDEIADEIAEKFLNVVTNNYNSPNPGFYTKENVTYTRSKGLTWEKYTINGTINDNEYPSNEMLGWTGGVFVDLYHSLHMQ